MEELAIADKLKLCTVSYGHLRKLFGTFFYDKDFNIINISTGMPIIDSEYNEYKLFPLNEYLMGIMFMDGEYINVYNAQGELVYKINHPEIEFWSHIYMKEIARTKEESIILLDIPSLEYEVFEYNIQKMRVTKLMLHVNDIEHNKEENKIKINYNKKFAEYSNLVPMHRDIRIDFYYS